MFVARKADKSSAISKKKIQYLFCFMFLAKKVCQTPQVERPCKFSSPW